jgi:hypothetical protein
MKRKSKRKKTIKPIVPLPPEKRKLPRWKYGIGDVKNGIMEGELLFGFIVMQYNRKSEREYLDATLPLDYLEKVKEAYYHPQYITMPSTKSKKYNFNPEYTEYLKSKEWRELRKRILSTRNKCEMCGESDTELHLHHLTYENFKHEKDEDMQVLCYDCHSAIHGRKVGFQRNRVC